LDLFSPQANIKVSSISLDENFNEDATIQIKHTTTSCEIDLHKLVLKLNCYQLNQGFKEALSAGRDDQFQLG
jgi:hypothetical protein